MSRRALRARLHAGEPLDGVFVKTPSHQVIEVLATSTVDVAMLDTEHTLFGPAELDATLAVAHALEFPCLVRVAQPSGAPIQQALDAGATGVVVPHVDSAALAADVVRWSEYGEGGRGYSGSTRAAGWGTRPMADVLRSAAETTTVVIQVEDAAALRALDDLMAVNGVDAVFVGVADLTVALGQHDPSHRAVADAVEAILKAARQAGRPTAAYAATSADAEAWRRRGVTLVCTGSDQSRLRTPTQLGSPWSHQSGRDS